MEKAAVRKGVSIGLTVTGLGCIVIGAYQLSRSGNVNAELKSEIKKVELLSQRINEQAQEYEKRKKWSIPTQPPSLGDVVALKTTAVYVDVLKKKKQGIVNRAWAAIGIGLILGFVAAITHRKKNKPVS